MRSTLFSLMKTGFRVSAAWFICADLWRTPVVACSPVASAASAASSLFNRQAERAMSATDASRQLLDHQLSGDQRTKNYERQKSILSSVFDPEELTVARIQAQAEHMGKDVNWAAWLLGRWLLAAHAVGDRTTEKKLAAVLPKLIEISGTHDCCYAWGVAYYLSYLGRSGKTERYKENQRLMCWSSEQILKADAFSKAWVDVMNLQVLADNNQIMLYRSLRPTLNLSVIPDGDFHGWACDIIAAADAKMRYHDASQLKRSGYGRH